MPILTVDDISKNFGTRDVLSHVSFTVNEGDRIAFIGNNGAGKSTLFKIIKGAVRADSGRVILHGNTIVGFLSQNMDEQDMSTTGLKPKALTEVEERKAELESMLAVEQDEASLKELTVEYNAACAAFEAMGGYDYEYRMSEALAGLGLTGLSGREDLGTLSGGEKMRVCLASLIVSHPDIIMLDEPTNHLDMQAVEWLENFLQSYGGAVFIITHDRYFIDKVATRVIELTDGRITQYKGNYDDYRTAREQFLKTQTALVKNLEDELEHQLDVKQTMLSHRNISGYHQREKMVDKVYEVLQREKAKLPSGQGRMSFNASYEERSGASDKLLLKAKDLSKKFGDDPDVFNNVSFEVKAGEKVFICGSNGCGKSTLLAMLLGKMSGNEGTVTVAANATMGYMEQFVPFADEDADLFEELIGRSDLGRSEARGLLARFGFRGDDVFKKIRMLSGGERSRLYLCCLLQENPDMLFLDEPTNHLDIESREILEDALKAYSGAIVCVSHDRFFVEKCADKVLGFRDGSACIYDSYEAYRRELKRPAAKEKTASEPKKEEDRKSGVNPALERKKKAQKAQRIRDIEKEISDLEAMQKELSDSFTSGCSTEQYQIYADNAAKLELLYDEYLSLSEG